MTEAKFLALIVLGCVVMSISAIVKRTVMKTKQISAMGLLVWQFGFAALTYGAIYISIWGWTVPEVRPRFWLAALLCAGANFVIQWLNTKAASLDKGEVSVTAPLQAMTPGMITFLAITLGEFPGPLGIAGIFCMAAGTYYITWPKQREGWYDWIGPVHYLRKLWPPIFKQLTKDEQSFTLAVSLAMVSAAMGTFGLLFESLYTRRGGGMQGLVMGSMTVCATLCVSYSLWYMASQTRPGAIRPQFSKRLIWGALILSVLFVASWMLIQPGFMYLLTSYVGTLKRLSILLSVILGITLLGEAKSRDKTRKQLKDRLWAAGLITLGSILIGFDGISSRAQVAFEELGF